MIFLWLCLLKTRIQRATSMGSNLYKINIKCLVWRMCGEFMNLICLYVLSGAPAGGYLYRQEGSGLSLAHTSSQPYISPWIKVPREYSIQTFSSNVKSNPNISSVLPKLGMKGFIQSSWAAGARGTVYTTCGNARYMLHAVMLPATTYIIARPPSQYGDMLP